MWFHLRNQIFQILRFSKFAFSQNFQGCRSFSKIDFPKLTTSRPTIFGTCHQARFWPAISGTCHRAELWRIKLLLDSSIHNEKTSHWQTGGARRARPPLIGTSQVSSIWNVFVFAFYVISPLLGGRAVPHFLHSCWTTKKRNRRWEGTRVGARRPFWWMFLGRPAAIWLLLERIKTASGKGGGLRRPFWLMFSGRPTLFGLPLEN